MREGGNLKPYQLLSRYIIWLRSEIFVILFIVILEKYLTKAYILKSKQISFSTNFFHESEDRIHSPTKYFQRICAI